MYRLYAAPLSHIIIFMVIGNVAWIVAAVWMKKKKKLWRTINSAFLVIAIGGIIYVTMWHRTSGTRSIEWIPFITFAKAKIQPEYYRTMLMNVFLFYPFGLTFPFVISDRTKYVFLKSTLTACALSIIIETLQFVLCVGYSEMDDIIMNTIGAAIGGVAYLVSSLINVQNK